MNPEEILSKFLVGKKIESISLDEFEYILLNVDGHEIKISAYRNWLYIEIDGLGIDHSDFFKKYPEFRNNS